MKKIILINANLMKPLIAPIGLDYVAQALDDAGFKPEMLDLALEENPDKALRNAFRGNGALLVGLTVRNIDDCYMSSGESFIPELQNWVNKIKMLSDAPVVLGGVGYSISPRSALIEIGADFGIAGEGEGALAALARSLNRGVNPLTVPGLVYRSGDEVFTNAPKLLDLKKHSPRKRSYVSNRDYFRLGGQGSVETKRGCNQNCVYCADPVAKGKAVRLTPPKNVADEFMALYSQDVDVLHICDSEFNVPYDHALGVCEELIKRKIGDKVKWYAYLSPAFFDKALAEAMRDAGCVGINFGCDSANREILKKLGRSHNSKDIKRAVGECRRAGIKVMLDLLVGGPGETPETAKHTIGKIKEFDPDRVGISLGIRVFEGTAFAGYVGKERIELRRPRNYGSDDLLYPAFYVSPELGNKPDELVSELVDGDPRFFFADVRKDKQNYNYSDNFVLVDAIKKGYRGAYWDILRKLADKK